jgi:hypothetical protein
MGTEAAAIEESAEAASATGTDVRMRNVRFEPSEASNIAAYAGAEDRAIQSFAI